VGLLDSSGGRSRFPGSLGGELLPGGLSSGRFTGGSYGLITVRFQSCSFFS
jgi:hypothetical protein